MCVYYAWDEEWECYVCDANLDMDELERVMSRGASGCPYFRLNDEYGIVRKQA